MTPTEIRRYRHRTRLSRLTEARPNVLLQAEQFRRRLIDREQQTVDRMLETWADVRRNIDAEIRGLIDAVKDAANRGVDVSPSWLQQLDRWAALRRQVDREVAGYVRFASRQIIDAQADVIAWAQQDAEQLTMSQLAGGPDRAQAALSFNRLPTVAVEQMVGQTAAGPLFDLLATIPAETSDVIARELVAGVAMGRSPREVARAVSKVADLPRWRSVTIARTETLRAYREAARRSYETNLGVVKAWEWEASLDDRTCPVCWAMHGTRHAPDEPFATHPSCRCSPIPVTKSWRELGFDGPDDELPRRPSGPERFDRLPAGRQAQILGPGKLALYRAGVPLADMVGFRVDRRWGPVRFEKPLSRIVKGAA